MLGPVGSVLSTKIGQNAGEFIGGIGLPILIGKAIDACMDLFSTKNLYDGPNSISLGVLK